MKPAPDSRAANDSGAPKAAISVVSQRALCGAALFFLLLPTLFFPPQPDSSIYWLAGRAIGRGEMPYSAVFDIKPPGIHLLFALPASLGASAMESWVWVRCFDAVLLILGAFLFGRLAKQVLGESLAPAATLCFLALHLSGQMASFAQTETWALPFFLFAWWILPFSATNDSKAVSQSKTGGPVAFGSVAWRFALSGLTTGFVLICKPTSALPMVGLLAASLWPGARPQISTRFSGTLRNGALWFSGLIFPVAGVFFWLQTRGAWPDFVDIWRRFLTPYIASARDPAPAHLLVWIFLAAFYVARFPLPTTLIFLGFLARASWKPGAKRLILVVLAGCVAALWVQNRLFEYHLKILLPVAAMAVTAGAAEVARVAHLSPRRTAIFFCALPALYALWTRGAAIIAAPLTATNHFPRAKWFGILEKNDHVARRDESLAAAGDWMRKRARAGDTLMVWGFAPQLYLWSDLKPAGRFMYLPPLAASYAPSKWRTEFLTRFKAQPPRFFVLVDEDLRWHGVKEGTPARVLQGWKSLDEFFGPRYRRVAGWPDLEVWERK